MGTQQTKETNKMPLANDPLALRKLNEQNTKFYLNLSELTLERITDPVLFKLAKLDMYSDAVRHSHLYSQKTLELALADAAQARSILQKEFSLKGCRARKPDSLQQLIFQFASHDSDLSERQLLHKLKKQVELGIIYSIDDRQIKFIDHNLKLKTAPISGLKDRLSRARSKINSR